MTSIGTWTWVTHHPTSMYILLHHRVLPCVFGFPSVILSPTPFCLKRQGFFGLPSCLNFPNLYIRPKLLLWFPFGYFFMACPQVQSPVTERCNAGWGEWHHPGEPAVGDSALHLPTLGWNQAVSRTVPNSLTFCETWWCRCCTLTEVILDYEPEAADSAGLWLTFPPYCQEMNLKNLVIPLTDMFCSSVRGSDCSPVCPHLPHKGYYLTLLVLCIAPFCQKLHEIGPLNKDEQCWFGYSAKIQPH